MSPRPLRVQAAGATYHAFANATGQEFLYRDGADRGRFLSHVEATVARYGIKLHLYVVLGTHHHLLLTTPQPNIGVAMQYLNGRYCQSYNRRHRRKGLLLAGRYGTELVRSEQHGLWLVAYLALNPVRAGLVRRPEDWPWSSYRSLIGLAPEPDFVEPRLILEQFDRDPGKARAAIVGYVESILAEDRRAAAA